MIRLSENDLHLAAADPRTGCAALAAF
jgi:hypothetical protein